MSADGRPDRERDRCKSTLSCRLTYGIVRRKAAVGTERTEALLPEVRHSIDELLLYVGPGADAYTAKPRKISG
jgi:hypothetical protein